MRLEVLYSKTFGAYQAKIRTNNATLSFTGINRHTLTRDAIALACEAKGII